MTSPIHDTRNRRILIVDDTRAIHDDFRKILCADLRPPDALDNLRATLFGASGRAPEAVRFVIESAFQGEEAAAKVKAALDAAEPYAMAFVDMRMPPGWDGLETIEHLWRLDPRLEIVICTAYSDHSWEGILQRLGRTDQLLLLKKPFDNTEVSQLACALTEKWHLARKADRHLSDLEAEVKRRTGELATKATQLEREMADRNLAQDRLRYSATHDALTGLPNRVAFLEALSAEVSRSEGPECESNFAVLFLDMDNFKTINDSLGHGSGDELLVLAAGRLTEALATFPGGTMLARLGGDEFVILLKSVRSVADAEAAADGVRQEFQRPFGVSNQEVAASMSIGIAMGDSRKNADTLLRNADTAMYRAKLAGKARFAVFDEVMHAEVSRRLELENSLRVALERGQFVIEYQPIVFIDTARIRGFEALVRWSHPARGLLGPAEFIPVAEEIGMIVPLGRWVMETACRQIHQWNLSVPSDQPLSISVNISRRQLREPQFVADVAQLLADTGLPERLLHLEITESAIMEDVEVMIGVMQRLRDLGVAVEMDDFGTGHSSLSCLHQFPLDTLKIDRSFIATMGTDRKYAAIVQAIVTLADTLGMKVLAEGIETPDQLRQLLALKCHYGQGFLFSPPVSASNVPAMLRTNLQFSKAA